MSEAFTTYGIGPGKYADELQALRDERDRLNIAMAQATMALRYYAKTAISFRAVEALDKIEAALTPAGGAPQRWTRRKPTAPGWYWWREGLDAQPALYPVEWKPVWKCWGIPGKRVDEMLGEWQGPLTPNEATE